MSKLLLGDSRFEWMNGTSIRPYVFVRKQNQINDPGRAELNWFPFEPIVKDPQAMAEEDFTNQIINLENHVFGERLAMPRWVFYDCGVMPGFIAGFAIQKSKASESILKVTRPQSGSEWVPISLFITIPTMTPGEWVAHNLSSVNSALPADERFYGLGFLSKAFGLWFANVEVCCGMTQWRGPALRLHSHYGDYEVLTAYTPSHTVAETMTYRLQVRPKEWHRFFTHKPSDDFNKRFVKADLNIDRTSVDALKALQARIEAGEGPYYLNADEIISLPLDSELELFRRR